MAKYREYEKMNSELASLGLTAKQYEAVLQMLAEVLKA